MEPNYMAYAEYMGRRNPTAQGLNSLGDTLQQIQGNQRQRGIDERQMRLSDLQMQQQEAQLADQQAQQGAKQQLYGAADSQEAYLKQAQAQQQAELHKKDMEVEKQILDLVGKGKERGLKAEQLNPIIQAWSSDIQNPKKKEMYQNLKLNDNWGSTTKIMLDGSEGINHPITGKPLTAGVYQIEFDQNRKPVKVDFVQEVKLEAKGFDTIDLGDRVEVIPRDGGQPTVKKKALSPAAQIRVVSGGQPQGKLSPGYRWTADGNQEAIPGGPADVKQETRRQANLNAVAAIDDSTNAIDRLLNHPGRLTATGLSSRLDPRNYVPGTDAYDFAKELESFDSKLFLSNISAMKGMGALSNAEGMKVSAAAGAIKPGMSEKAFVVNMNIIKSNLEKARQRVESGNLTQGKPANRPDPLGLR